MNRFPLARAAAIVALALLVAISALLAPARPIAAADTDDLLGTVIDAETKKPIVGALVSVWRDDTPADPRGGGSFPERLDWPAQASRSAVTDPDGAFAFAGEPRSLLRWFSVSADGYAPVAELAKDDGGAVTISIEKVQPTKLRLLRATAAGTEPAAGVEIFLARLGPSAGDRKEVILAARYTVPPDGELSVPCGSKTWMLARGPGVATAFVPRDQTGPLVLAPGGEVSGVVVSPSGAPIAGADIYVEGVGFRRVRSITDSAGGFRVEGVPCGGEPHVLTAWSPGCLPVERRVQGGTRELRIVASPGARVRGRLLDAGGAPVSGAEVTVVPAGTAPELRAAEYELSSDTVRTGPDGRFAVSGVAPGIRAVVGRSPGGLTWRAAIDVTAEAESVEAPMTLVRTTATVPVLVIDDAGLPVAGIEVADDRNGVPARTAADGTATLTAERTTYPWTGLWLSGGRLGSARVFAWITGSCARAGRVTIRLCPTATLRVTAKRADGTVLDADAFGYVVGPADEQEAPVCRDQADGLLTGPSAPVPGGRTIRVVAVEHATEAKAARTVSVDPVKGGDLELVFPGYGALTARIPDGFPVRATYARATTDPISAIAPQVVRREDADADGSFSLRGLFAGNWTLSVVCRRMPAALIAVREIRVAETGGVIDLGNLPAPAAAISGVVRFRGRGVPGAEVRLTLPGGHEVPFSTLPDGSYLIRVPAGLDADVAIHTEGCGWATKRARAGATSVDFELEPAATLVLLNCFHDSGFAHPISVRSAGVSAAATPSQSTDVAVVRGVAPGAVEIVVGEGKTARTIRVDAPAGKTTFVDLATAK